MEKSESEKRKRLLFIGGLVFTALAINGAVYVAREKTSTQTEPARPVFPTESDSAATARRNSEDRKAEEERKATAAAAEHAKFLEHHLNTGFVRKPGLKTVGMAVACDGKMHHAMDAALMNRFQQESVQILPFFFTSEFVSDGLFDGAFTGSKEVFTKLELAKHVDALVLAREEVQYSTNPASLQNVLTATIRLEVTSFSIPANALVETWTFVANGAGFKEPEARAMAEERLAKQIAKDTKMSLPP